MSTALNTLSLKISTGGTWLELEGGAYELTANTFAQVQQSWRKVEAESPLYDGTYQTHATKGNVMETVEIRVRADNLPQLYALVETIVRAFEQPTYLLVKEVGGYAETWTCFTAEYSIDIGHVHLHTAMATLSFQVPRLP